MKRTKQTLLMQMKITDIEIERRKELLRFSDEDMELLVRCKVIIDEEIDTIVRKFYDVQTSIEEIDLLIGDADTLHRLLMAQRKYVLDLFGGFVDMEYVNNRLRIGLVHKRIGVEPKLYLSAVEILRETIYTILARRIDDKETLRRTDQALHKLLFFDITLVFDTYIRSLMIEREAAKERAESYALNLEEKVAERTRQLEELAVRDPLTNLFNQRALRESLRREVAHAKRRSLPLSFIYFDVDNFKQLNDLHGHLYGDQILKDIGEILLKHCRDVDVPCRYGGDEFCVILPDCDIAGAEEMCNRFIEAFRQKYDHVTLSFGIVQTGPETFLDADELVKIADRKMYEAKGEPGFRIKK